MRTIHEVSELAGVSIRTLQYYDRIGLLHPSEHTESGYRLYDDTDLERLQQILLFRALEFPLKDIREIISCPGFDREKALEQQIELLTLRREHIESLIALAREIKETGGNPLNFTAFDTGTIDEYAAQAKAAWGNTPAYREFEEKDKTRTPEERQAMPRQMMNIFAELGAIRAQGPQSEAAQALVKRLQDFITERFYTCSDEILAELGKLYGAGGDFTKNIDQAAGAGTAEFSAAAIEAYCRQRR